jgi:hypothetical protein
MELRDSLAGVATLQYEPSKGVQQPAQKHLQAARNGFGELLPPPGE